MSTGQTGTTQTNATSQVQTTQKLINTDHHMTGVQDGGGWVSQQHAAARGGAGCHHACAAHSSDQRHHAASWAV